MLPNERLAQFDHETVAAGYDVDEMGRLFEEFQEQLTHLTESELFSLGLHTERSRSVRRSLMGYIALEQARREE